MISDASLSPNAWAALAALVGRARGRPRGDARDLARIAWATGYLDHPEARKLHIAATPLLGGVAVALGTALGANLGFWSLDMGLPQQALWWMAGALVAVGIGLVDDRVGLGPGAQARLPGARRVAVPRAAACTRSAGSGPLVGPAPVRSCGWSGS